VGIYYLTSRRINRCLFLPKLQKNYVNKGREFMELIIEAIFYTISAFLLVMITRGFLAVICCKNKREFWNEAFWAALTLDRKYLTEYIDYDKFLKLVHILNLIATGGCLIVLLIVFGGGL